MRSLTLKFLVVLIAATAPWHGATGQDKHKATLKEDRQKLAGLWRTEGWRKEGAKGWQCHAGVSLQDLKYPHASLTINFEFEGTMPPHFFGAPVQVAEKGEKRWFEVPPDVAMKAGLPTEIFFRLEGEALKLKVAEGKCKGEYLLEHYKK